MVDQLSPLGLAWRPGAHGHVAEGIGVSLIETQPASIVQLAAWPGRQRQMLEAIGSIAGFPLPDGAGAGFANGTVSAFGFAPGRFLVVHQEDDLSGRFASAIASDVGVVTDLSHGRTAIGIAGTRAEWVLSKLFAVDFSSPALPVGCGISTAHHDIAAQIQRIGDNRFDLYVFRSFARSAWKLLCRSSEEVGYEVR
jgi:heterotetrameric sarcosine oxidase gamma subunit